MTTHSLAGPPALRRVQGRSQSRRCKTRCTESAGAQKPNCLLRYISRGFWAPSHLWIGEDQDFKTWWPMISRDLTRWPRRALLLHIPTDPAVELGMQAKSVSLYCLELPWFHIALFGLNQRHPLTAMDDRSGFAFSHITLINGSNILPGTVHQMTDLEASIFSLKKLSWKHLMKKQLLLLLARAKCCS